MSLLLRLALLLMVFGTTTWSLRCISCDSYISRCQKLSSKDCPYGIEKDVCNCCDKCLNKPGARCGGTWNMFGSCGKGLTCKSRKDKRNRQPVGICVNYSLVGAG